MFGLKAIGVLRISEAEELEGLDIAEHGAPAYHPEYAYMGYSPMPAARPTRVRGGVRRRRRPTSTFPPRKARPPRSRHAGAGADSEAADEDEPGFTSRFVLVARRA